MKPNCEIIECRNCKNKKQRLRGQRDGTGRWTFVDENGNLWARFLCPLCEKQRRTKNDRKNGHLPIDDVKLKSRKKSRQTEILAKKFFELFGYNVTLTTLHGPDLIIEKNGIKKTVEVKSVCKKRNSFYVPHITKNRITDDFIFIVVTKNFFVFETMKKHLTKCQKYKNNFGQRTITSIIPENIKKEFELCQAKNNFL